MNRAAFRSFTIALAVFTSTTHPGTAQVTKAVEELNRGRAAEAVAALTPHVNDDDSSAAFFLAVLTDLGAGAALDAERVRELLNQSIARGHRPATEYLAWKHRVGFGVEKDDAEADRLATVAQALPEGVNPVPTTWLARRDRDFQPGFRRALLWMLDVADTGDRLAMSNLATAFAGGPWTPADPQAHVHWLERAGNAGDGAALERLSLYHSVGLYVKQDPARADTFLLRAAEAGQRDSQYRLAEQLAEAEPPRIADAVAWYAKAAAHGHTEAILELGRRYRDGRGVAQDHAAALALYKKGAQLDDASCIADLGDMYASGSGVTADPHEAARLYMKASERGSGWASTQLARLMKSGAIGAVDWTQIKPVLERGVEQGSTVAMCDLAELYREGNGVEKDLGLSFQWIERAARKGNTWAQNRIGWLLRNGDGIERDDEEAVTWFRLAAEEGESAAMGNLGFHYAHGRGVEKDVVAGFVWLTRSLRELDSTFFKSELMRLIHDAGDDDTGLVAASLRELLAGETIPPASLLAEVVTMTLLDGRERLRDPNRGVAMLMRGVEAGADWAKLALAERKLSGSQVDMDIPGARLLAQKLSAAGNVRAFQLLLNVAAAEGGDAFKAETARVTALAEGGDKTALFALAIAYGEAEFLDPDPERSSRLLESAILTVRREKGAVEGRSFEESVRAFWSTLPTRSQPPDVAARIAGLSTSPGESRHPVVLHSVGPAFPIVLKSHGITGSATVTFVVDANGLPVSVETERATHPLFARTAEVAIRQWRFAPGLKDGKPVRTSMTQTFRFNLNR